jgi:hypothetical protein
MSRHYDIFTADGSSRTPKLSLDENPVIDMEKVRKTDEGKVAVRIDKNTIKLIKK